MALTKVSGGILDPGINVAGIVTATGFDGPFTGGSGSNINAGIITATGFDLNGNGDISGNLVIGGNLTANGDFTTLNTTLREVEILRVDANTTAVAGIITQRGSGDIFSAYDTSTEVFKITDGGRVFIGESSVAGSAKFVVGNGGAENFEFTSGMASSYEGGVLEYIHRGDGNTRPNLNFYVNNTGQHKFWTAGSERLTITNDGKVGIGTGIPTSNLDVRGTSSATISIGLQGISYGAFACNSSSNILYAYNGNDIIFSTHTGGGFDQKVTIKNNGNVGINSTIPSQLLDVAGTIKTANITSDSSNLSIENTADRVMIKSANRIDLADNMVRFQNRAQNATLLEAVAGASGYVKLFHNDSLTASVTQDALTVTGRTNNSGMIEIASNQGANNNDRFRIHKTSAASRLTIQAYSTGSWVENIRITAGGAVELKHADGTTKLETTSAGSKISGNLELSSTYPSLTWTDTNHNSDFRITNDDGKLIVYDITRSAHVLNFLANGDLQIPENKGLYIGESNDLLLGHDGSLTRITDTYGHMKISSNVIEITNQSLGENYIKCTNNAAVDLYYDASTYPTPKLSTSTTGITVDGEVAASQDYPNFRPTLDFNFAATKKLDPRITYTRTGPASFVNEFGKVVLVGDNTPKFDHDPDTRESKGLLIEESRTNLLYPSSNWSSTYWSLTGVTSEPFTTDTEDPAGTFTASKLIPINANNSLKDIHWASSSLTFTTGVKYAASVFAKSTTGLVLQLRPRGQGSNKAWVNYNLSTGTIGNYGGTALLTKEIEKYPNGWYRCSLTFTGSGDSGAGFGTLIMDDDTDTEAVAHTGDSSKSMYLWGAQHEQGAFVTSYIPAPTTAAATRGADTTFIDGDDFTDFYNQPEGTIVSSHSLLDNIPATHNVYTYQVAPDSGTSEAPFRLIDRNGAYGDTLVATSITNNAIVAFFKASGDPVTPANKKMKVAFAIKTNDFAASFNGGTVVTDTSGTVSQTNDHLAIGYYKPSPQAYLNGHIQRLMYYPSRLSNTQLQNLSS